MRQLKEDVKDASSSGGVSSVVDALTDRGKKEPVFRKQVAAFVDRTDPRKVAESTSTRHEATGRCRHPHTALYCTVLHCAIEQVAPR